MVRRIASFIRWANQEQFFIRIMVVLLNDEGWLDEICTENCGLDD